MFCVRCAACDPAMTSTMKNIESNCKTAPGPHLNKRNITILTEHIQSYGPFDRRHHFSVCRLTSKRTVVRITTDLRNFQSINDHMTSHCDAAGCLQLIAPIIPSDCWLRSSCVNWKKKGNRKMVRWWGMHRKRNRPCPNLYSAIKHMATAQVECVDAGRCGIKLMAKWKLLSMLPLINAACEIRNAHTTHSSSKPHTRTNTHRLWLTGSHAHKLLCLVSAHA